MVFIRKYVHVGDGPVHIRDTEAVTAGETLPLVCLHQTASSGMMYDRMEPCLGRSRRVLALDTPGFGASFDPDHAPSLSDYARWLLSALDGLGISRFHLLGHHTGGCIALEMAQAVPDRVASLFIIGPVYLSAGQRQEYRSHYSTPFRPDWDGRYLLETFEMVRNLATGDDLDLQHRETVAALRAWKSRADAYNAVWDTDLSGLIDRAVCPLLFGCAEDDVLWKSFEDACTARPDAGRVTLAGGNFEPDRDPKGCAAAANAFADAIESEGRVPAWLHAGGPRSDNTAMTDSIR